MSSIQMQQHDEKRFGKFLVFGRLGDQWAPTEHEQWDTYKRIAGVQHKETKTDTAGLIPDSTRFWFKTHRTNLWYCEVRLTGTTTVRASYFHWYSLD